MSYKSSALKNTHKQSKSMDQTYVESY